MSASTLPSSPAAAAALVAGSTPAARVAVLYALLAAWGPAEARAFAETQGPSGGALELLETLNDAAVFYRYLALETEPTSADDALFDARLARSRAL